MGPVNDRPVRARRAAADPEHPTRLASVESPATLRRLTSDSLFAGGSEIEIEHAGSVYRLRLTSSGKLILTK